MKYLAITAVLMLFSNNSFSLETVEISYGTAVDKRGGIVYREKHTSRFFNGQLQNLKTEYFSNEGGAFGSINSNFVKNSFVPNYQFEDNRHGRLAGVKWQKNDVIAFAKGKKRSDRKEKNFVVNKNTVAGQGLHNFIRQHIDDFAKSTKHFKTINFLIPMNQDVYTFRVRTKEVDKAKGVVKVRIEAESWLFRLVAPHIDVIYEIKSRRLLEYKGPSNLLSDNKKQMNVTISYKYPVNVARN